MIRIISTETSPQRFPKKPFKFIEDSINMQLSERAIANLVSFFKPFGSLLKAKLIIVQLRSTISLGQ